MPASPSTSAWTSLKVVCCCSHSRDSLSVQLIFTTSSWTSFWAAWSSSKSGCETSVCFSSLWINSSYRGIFCTGLINNWSNPSFPLCSRSIACHKGKRQLGDIDKPSEGFRGEVERSLWRYWFEVYHSGEQWGRSSSKRFGSSIYNFVEVVQGFYHSLSGNLWRCRPAVFDKQIRKVHV